MIRISQIKLPISHNAEDLTEAVKKALNIKKDKTFIYHIVKKSIDARKNDLKYVYCVDVDIDNENTYLKYSKNNNISVSSKKCYSFDEYGGKPLNTSPVIAGCGPAGLFCAYLLALKGYRPVIIERGSDVDKRKLCVNEFFRTGNLDINTNVQFGEGGAGTFSDGKLNTMVKDKFGRNDFVLDTFVRFGADEKIKYLNKPHIGTDILADVIKNMRNECIRMGARFLFETKLTDIIIEKGMVKEVETTDSNGVKNRINCEVLVLAIGHSARDTFSMIYGKKLMMEPKAFAVGVRIEHPRKDIDMSQYGDYADMLPAADYKLASNLENGRGVYSFCMCPGGYVVNSSSEKGYTAVNGMSYSNRDGINSNTAIIVTVRPEDFADKSPLGGLEFQRRLEKAAFIEGKSKIPIQLYGDFKNNVKSVILGNIIPQTKGAIEFANLRNIFPEYINESLIKGIESFSSKIKDYNRADAVMSGVESRTSSPLRIIRDETFQSNIKGIYPCGEGAGYAGGITSAAMDGIKVFEAVARVYAPLTE